MREEARERVEALALRRGFVIQELLGDGMHGSVWKVASQDGTYAWVVKMHRYPAAWHREVRCYERLLGLFWKS